MIQSGINQLFTSAAAFATLSPGLRARREQAEKLSRLGKREQVVTKAAELASPDMLEEYQGELEDIRKEIFETKPTEESYKAYKETIPKTVTVEAEPEELAQEEAEDIIKRRGHESLVDEKLRMLGQAPYYSRDQVMSKVSQKGTETVEQKKQRRNFMDYLKGEETSFGKFETLNPKLQKAIMSDYSKAERRKIMDLKDKERGK